MASLRVGSFGARDRSDERPNQRPEPGSSWGDCPLTAGTYTVAPLGGLVLDIFAPQARGRTIGILYTPRTAVQYAPPRSGRSLCCSEQEGLLRFPVARIGRWNEQRMW